MEAFLNPSVAVAAQTLEVTVQLALDFIDELVGYAAPPVARATLWLLWWLLRLIHSHSRSSCDQLLRVLWL